MDYLLTLAFEEEEEFTAVSAGEGISCGLRTDGTVTCWTSRGRWSSAGSDRLVRLYDPMAKMPAGEFPALSAGVCYSCWLRTDRTVTCWGRNDFGQAEAPAGEFTAVSAGRFHSCGLRTDGTITCWGDPTGWGLYQELD